MGLDLTNPPPHNDKPVSFLRSQLQMLSPNCNAHERTVSEDTLNIIPQPRALVSL